jgi:Tol biopolymer transport system component
MPSLQPGTRLGPYEITGSLGAGGMGEVYRARDPRLGREVAVKCLSAALSGDASSRQRIEREARATAALSHPHICTLFDVGQHNGETFLVMELLEGMTLADRLARARGGLSLDEVMRIAIQLADALAVAHRHGLVHRDIKPGNVMITAAGVKLLDFGLAKPAQRASDETRSLITQPHDHLGTPAYMAPEQLTGAVDHRSDIYALGAVMFEMLTGARALTTAGTPAALRPDTPPAFDRVVRKCLERNPDQRWQSAADLADELRWIASGPLPTRAQRPPNSMMVAGAIALVAVAAALIALPRFGRGLASGVEHLAFLLPPNAALPSYGTGVALSPDGSIVVFAATAGTGGGMRTQLFAKRFDAREPRLIANSEGALYPFFSPDGQSVAFFGSGQLRKWSISNDAVSTIAKLTGAFDTGSQASWGTGDVLLFGIDQDQPRLGIRRMAATGGEIATLTRPDNARGEQLHYGPQQLPGGQILFTVRSISERGAEYSVVGLRSSGAITPLIPGASMASYLGGNELLYQLGTSLILADFNPSSLQLSNARQVLDNVQVTTNGSSWAAAGDTLVYRPVEAPRRRLVWVDRSGRITPIETELRNFLSPHLSPSGERVLVTLNTQGAAFDVWILDLPRGTLTPLTSDGLTAYGVWSPEGTQFIATRRSGAGLGVILQPADGSSSSRVLLHTGEQTVGAALAAESKSLVVMTPGRDTGPDIAVMDRDDPSSLRYIVQTPATEFGGRISPNGKWLSYFSDTSGRMELWVTPFPQGGPKWQLSRNGAREAVWAKDGRELYFRLADTMYAITVHDSPTFAWEAPRELFKGTFFEQGGPGIVNYDVERDGRFLMIQETPPQSPSFNVVRGWRQLAR